jgi:hypothetical protein
MAVIAVGVLMLAIGGVLGYLIGHANAKTKFKPSVASTPRTPASGPTRTTTLTASTTLTTPARTITRPAKIVNHVRTVTTPARTVTTSQPAKIITKTTTRTITSTITTTASASTTSSSTSTGTQSFNGTNTQNVGTIHVATPSTLRWSCAGCATTTFSITNSSTDPTPIQVQAQNATSGQANIASGTYTNLTGQGTGPWSFTITPTTG